MGQLHLVPVEDSGLVLPAYLLAFTFLAFAVLAFTFYTFFTFLAFADFDFSLPWEKAVFFQSNLENRIWGYLQSMIRRVAHGVVV